MAAYAALISLMNIVDNIQLHPRPPISLHKKKIHLLTEKVTFLQKFLEGYNPNLVYTMEADPLESRIVDAAYEAEDAIESHIMGQTINSGALYEALEMVIKEMALIEKEAMEIKETLGVQNQLHKSSASLDSSRSSSTVHKSGMVGADDVLLQMKDKLTSHCRDLQIIPVVGMGGTGKTTLAINIYQDRLVKDCFDICAWATISQEYSVRKIFIEVLHRLNDEVDPCLSEDALGDILHKHLFGRKYLIILDDMWSIEVWDEVRRYFPDNENGSRIVITTRLSNLASQLAYDSDRLEMKLLDEVDSWYLLSKIVFGEEACPLELEGIGKEIGKSCKGLPLSIVVVGGFLAKSQHTREFWEYIEENLNSIVNLEDDARCLKILYMSYRQLPIHLKPCFLYMGVFPEEVIRISKLIKLWVAEGFLKPLTGKSMEEIAGLYLKDLADRNLVLIDKIGKTGNIKCCKIHDLLKDMCLREAKKERFYAATSRGIVNDSQRRIVISKNEDINALSSMSLVRSLMWNLHNQSLPPLSNSLRLLRIFDSPRFKSSADAVHQLFNSRFLAFSTTKFPSIICLFWNLQTLIVDVHEETTAPTNIWYMSHIRHVQFYPWLNLPDPPNGPDDIVLGNLQTLGRIRNFKCSEQVVKRIPNIKKLQIYYSEGFDDDRFYLSNLDRLDKLESLWCDIYQHFNRGPPASLHDLINFPLMLKKLSLQIRKSQCWQDILDKIGVLPLLQKLQLIFGRFKEGEWTTSEGQFCSLKFLSLSDCLGLEVWTTESSHFPCLEYLRLSRLGLKEIPSDFAEISTLKRIDLEHCDYSVAFSAKRILEEQEETQGESVLQVEVRTWINNEKLERLASPNFRVLCYQDF